jgi:DNA-binding CsgD family transcriptional regulator
LSKRETHVLDGLMRHESNKEIASRLAISERTVKFHVSNILAKFSVQRRADLILLSLQPAPAAG